MKTILCDIIISETPKVKEDETQPCEETTEESSWLLGIYSYNIVKVL